VAPFKNYLKRSPADGLIIVDDAHGAGVLGETGKGSLESGKVSRKHIVQCITLSKAFGTYGGAVLGTHVLRKKILARSRLFFGSTPLPLPLANAALQAVKILKADTTLRQRLLQNTDYVKTALLATGLEIPETPGPIIPFHFSDESKVAALKAKLLTAKIYPPFIQYPGGPANGYFRFVISSEHSRSQLDNLIAALAES
jgi:7-keto-8-aminopelargonate synthetase-like enzyme